MSIKGFCDECGERYVKKDSLAGQPVRCKHCGYRFVLPPDADAEEDYEDYEAYEDEDTPEALVVPAVPRRERRPSSRRSRARRRPAGTRFMMQREHYKWVWVAVGVLLILGFIMPWAYRPKSFWGPAKLFFVWDFLGEKGVPEAFVFWVVLGPIIGLAALILGNALKELGRGIAMMIAGGVGFLSILVAGKELFSVAIGPVISSTMVILNVLAFLSIFISIGGASVLVQREGKDGEMAGRLLAGIPACFYLLWTLISFFLVLSKSETNIGAELEGFALATVLILILSGLAMMASAILSAVNIGKGDGQMARVAIFLGMGGMGLMMAWCLVIVPLYILAEAKEAGFMIAFTMFVVLLNVFGRMFGYPLLIGFGAADMTLGIVEAEYGDRAVARSRYRARRESREQEREEAPAKESVSQRLQKLKSMLDEGLITEDDFERKKGDLLDDL
ncbi:MAG: SHOCT domain-containing protein [Planctomycetota bacterium]|jgi:hypothetical protein